MSKQGCSSRHHQLGAKDNPISEGTVKSRARAVIATDLVIHPGTITQGDMLNQVQDPPRKSYQEKQEAELDSYV